LSGLLKIKACEEQQIEQFVMKTPL